MKNSRKYSLAEAPEETSLKVVEIDSGCDCAGRLVGMGLIPGALLTIKRGSSSRKGPVKVMIGDSLIAVGRGLSQKIMVKTGDSGG